MIRHRTNRAVVAAPMVLNRAWHAPISDEFAVARLEKLALAMSR